MAFLKDASDSELWIFYGSLPSFLAKMAGHHSSRDNSWLEIKEDLEGYGLVYFRLQFRGLNIFCSMQCLRPFSHIPVHPHVVPFPQC